MRLIDADLLKEKLNELHGTECCECTDTDCEGCFLELIVNTPTVNENAEPYEGKPKCNGIYLVKVSGDINNPETLQPREYWTAKDITNIDCTVYNSKTNRYSDKSCYIDKRGKLYIKVRNEGRIYLEEFR